jgi:hypothetical protein
MGTQPTTTDYLAIIPIGTGNSWGRAPDKETAIENAIRSLRDWEVYYDLSEIDVTVNVIDVQGYSDCSWDNRGLHGTNEATGKDEAIKRPIEYALRITPKWKRRKR